MIYPRQFIEVSGVRLAYADIGSGPPVILLHGALTGADDLLLALGDALAGQVRLIAVDRPGYGGSEGDWETASIWRQATLLRGLSEALGLDRPIVVGHSFGGAVALSWAVQAPEELTAVVALAPLAFPEPRLEQVLFGPRAAPLVGDLLSFLSMPFDAVAMPAVWRAMFFPQPIPNAFEAAFPTRVPGERSRMKTVAREAARLLPDLTRSASLYGGARLPVRIICGDQDRVANPMLHGRALASILPEGRYRSVAGAGHMVHHARPDIVADAVLELVSAGAAEATVPA